MLSNLEKRRVYHANCQGAIHNSYPILGDIARIPSLCVGEMPQPIGQELARTIS
jgi:hypothetical protein